MCQITVIRETASINYYEVQFDSDPDHVPYRVWAECEQVAEATAKTLARQVSDLTHTKGLSKEEQ